MHYSFLLCRVHNETQFQKLAEIAANLDQKYFSCTFSVVNHLAVFDVNPHEDKTYNSADHFRVCAASFIINALAEALCPKV